MEKITSVSKGHLFINLGDSKKISVNYKVVEVTHRRVVIISVMRIEPFYFFETFSHKKNTIQEESKT